MIPIALSDIHRVLLIAKNAMEDPANWNTQRMSATAADSIASVYEKRATKLDALGHVYKATLMHLGVVGIPNPEQMQALNRSANLVNALVQQKTIDEGNPGSMISHSEDGGREFLVRVFGELARDIELGKRQLVQPRDVRILDDLDELVDETDED